MFEEYLEEKVTGVVIAGERLKRTIKSCNEFVRIANNLSINSRYSPSEKRDKEVFELIKRYQTLKKYSKGTLEPHFIDWMDNTIANITVSKYPRLNCCKLI
jgi:hypothetical protein